MGDEFTITVRCTACGEGRPVSEDPCPACGAPPFRPDDAESGMVGDDDGPPFE